MEKLQRGQTARRVVHCEFILLKKLTVQAQNSEYAADPIKFAARVRPPPLAPPPMPTPSPMTVGPSSVPPHVAQPASAASPVQLGSAGFLSNNRSEGSTNPASGGAAGAFAEGIFGDLQSMGMDELNALIAGTGSEFGATQPPPENGMTPNTSNLFDTITGNTTQPQPQVLEPAPEIQTQAPAEQQLQAQTQTQTQPEPAPQQAAAQNQPAPPFNLNFGDGEMDLSNIDLSALEGLFGGEGGEDMSAFSAFLDGSAENNAAPSQPGAQPAQQAEQSQVQQPQQPQAESAPPAAAPEQVPATGPAQAEPVPDADSAPAPAPASATEAQPIPAAPPQATEQTELGGDEYGGEMSTIDFDTFTFDDDMPDVDGDAFASMFAEFK